MTIIQAVEYRKRHSRLWNHNKMQIAADGRYKELL